MNGDVSLEVRCPMPEKLIDRALRRGARFYSVRRVDERTLRVTCDAASARVLGDLCRRFSLPLRTLGLSGLTRALRFAASRFTLLIGLAVGASLVALFLSRVWFIDVSASPEARSRLFDALNARGVRPGMSRDVDEALLSSELLSEVDGLSYVGVRLRGVRLSVKGVDEVPAPPLYDVSAARDLVSAWDGVVLSATARSGTLCVSPGDAVRRGQLLIRGEEALTRDETRPIAALGEVIVRTWYTGEARLPNVERRTEFTGRAAMASRLQLLCFDWPLLRASGFDHQVIKEARTPIGGLYLPVCLTRAFYRETRDAAVPAEPSALRSRAALLARADAATSLGSNGPTEGEILKSWIEYDDSEPGTLTARAIYEISVDAAVPRSALTTIKSD